MASVETRRKVVRHSEVRTKEPLGALRPASLAWSSDEAHPTFSNVDGPIRDLKAMAEFLRKSAMMLERIADGSELRNDGER